jgi:predicted RNA-binding Zn-ribbon protein involved in translation (DUF1610 family)
MRKRQTIPDSQPSHLQGPARASQDSRNQNLVCPAGDTLTHIGLGPQGRNATVCMGGPLLKLRQFLTYKATPEGIPVVVVDPATPVGHVCAECGSIHKDNRKTRATFSCVDCGYTAAADFARCQNIRAPGPLL